MREFEEICKAYYSRIYHYILGMTGNVDTAQDLVQDTFLIAYQKGKAFLHHENQIGFLYKTAHHLVMEQIRKNKKELLSEEQLDVPDGDALEKLIQQHYDRVDAESYKEEILDGLTTQEQFLYQAFYIEKRKMRDIAKELDINETTLRMKYVRLRMKIKKSVRALRLDEF